MDGGGGGEDVSSARLSGLDASFLSVETPTAHMHVGWVLAAAGPFVVGTVSAAAGGSSAVIIHTLFWIGIIPLAAAICAPFLIVETGREPLPS